MRSQSAMAKDTKNALKDQFLEFVKRYQPIRGKIEDGTDAPWKELLWIGHQPVFTSDASFFRLNQGWRASIRQFHGRFA